MKINRKNRAVLSGLLVGVASVYAVAGYFDISWSELGSFMLATLLFLGGIVLLAASAVLILKLFGRLLQGSQSPDEDRDKE